MDAFSLRERLVENYRGYVEGYLAIADPRIRRTVDDALADGRLWPHPLVQLNPAFQPGGTVDSLVDAGILQEGCRGVFRAGKSAENPAGAPITLYRHQTEAIKAARDGDNYVLTTGTGSGKSLAYIIPIVDHILREGAGKGMRAIVVYPMNALANSQENELRKFLDPLKTGQAPVRVRRYTGQEQENVREEIRANPPDVLLTNYVMLDLLLTRPDDCRRLIHQARHMRFVVLDELHTYRGRQGADIALLLRRLAHTLPAPPDSLRYVGTSATMSSEGAFGEQREVIARVAGRLFGSPVPPERVIGETLARATEEMPEGELKARLADWMRQGAPAEPPALPARHEDFIRHPMAIWLENTLGVHHDADGLLRRNPPLALAGEDSLAERLARDAEEPDPGRCMRAVRDALLAGDRCEPPSGDRRRKPFTFRVHQFFTRGDTVYATIAPPDRRFLTLDNQQFSPENSTERLYPLSFCRECGQEFYGVAWDEENRRWLPRGFDDRPVAEEGDGSDSPKPRGKGRPKPRPAAGYLFFDVPARPWPDEISEAIEGGRLPEDWVEEFRGAPRIKKSQDSRLPRAAHVAPDGREGDAGACRLHFIPAPFRFCPCCGVAYPGRTAEAAKLATLGAGGRSSATTLLAIAALRELRNGGAGKDARKLLAFSDNRQDVSLQAGHFNDFVTTVTLRSALYHALKDAGDRGLRPHELAAAVFARLALDKADYLLNPDIVGQALQEANAAFRDVLAWRLLSDWRRGRKLAVPNLEQVDLVRFEYPSLDELCRDEALWEGDVWRAATPDARRTASVTLLDHLRRELAVMANPLNETEQQKLRQRAGNHVNDRWAPDPDEKMDYAGVAWARPRGPRDRDWRGDVFLSPLGGFGRWLKRLLKAGNRKVDWSEVVESLFRALSKAGLVHAVQPAKPGEGAGWRLNTENMALKAGPGKRPYADPMHFLRGSDAETRRHGFFLDLYRGDLGGWAGLWSQEHTAQVPPDERQKREADFRENRLPALFCSPTMELGIDISDLPVVGLRNVPPTPANYAQRSGRAGRGGQAALVFTYCSAGSPHDQFYFGRTREMVAGAVRPPRLDLANEDLIRSHVHAIWLSDSGETLGKGLSEILDLGHPDYSEPALADSGLRRAMERVGGGEAAKRRARAVLAGMKDELERAPWYNEAWLERAFQAIPRVFMEACRRWWHLYAEAHAQSRRQHDISIDYRHSSGERREAERLEREARSQLELLLGKDEMRQGDFHPYRYFASEGFLPGFSFARLPLTAYVPAARARGRGDDHLSRPRFLAINEFGPRALIYHEGARFMVSRMSVGVPEDGGLPTREAKQCPGCGHMVFCVPGAADDVCQACGQELERLGAPLFRMRNVYTCRRERISSDEEERQRMGYELRTAVRFPGPEDGKTRVAEILGPDDARWGRLEYGQAATLWRLNMGWRRRNPDEGAGFVLDMESGKWVSKGILEGDDGDDEDDGDGGTRASGRRGGARLGRPERVIPYVEDTRNVLALVPDRPPDIGVMASLQAALRVAMMAHFQLEDSELAAEPLPTAQERRRILFFEAAEGGAGVLRQLVDDKAEWPRVVRKALEICHLDPDTGEDAQSADDSRRCVAGCYRCLLNYHNQGDHTLIDRRNIRNLLMEMSRMGIAASPAGAPRSGHMDALLALCDSDLEKRWLRWLDGAGGRLPDQAQRLLENPAARPDFAYHSQGGARMAVAVYVDGPPHDVAVRKERDAAQTRALEDAGWLVIRFGHEDDWDAIRRRHPGVFGNP